MFTSTLGYIIIMHVTITGSCPIRAPFAITSNCLMDYVGCRYDTECRGHM